MKKIEHDIQEVQVCYKRPEIRSMSKVNSSSDAHACFKGFLDEGRIDLKEFFLVMLLTRNNNVLGVSEVSSGTVSGCLVNITEIFQLAILTNASGLILCHNHPSGNLNPSASDMGMTKKIKTLCDLLEVQLLDHIILTSEGFYSFADEGVMP